jgi:hypothetical protein
MKKRLAVLFVAFMLFVGLTGCPGFNAGTAANMSTDVAFAAAMIKYPESKPVVIAALTALKPFLAKDVTYDELVIELSKQFGGKYASIGIIVADYFAADKPLFETYLTMLDSYKAALILKIDRFILIAGM